MRRLLVGLMMVASLSLAAAPAPATLGGLCCACLPGGNMNASLSGPPIELIPINALYCVDIPTAEMANQTQRCENLWGTLECAAFRDPVPCTAVLAEEGIACPASGAPVAGPWLLTGIVIALAAAGMLAARRRV